MKLIDLLTAMGVDNVNPKVNVAVYDDNDVALITYNAGGYAYVESDISNKKVKRVKVTSAQLVDVYISNEDEVTIGPGTSG